MLQQLCMIHSSTLSSSHFKLGLFWLAAALKRKIWTSASCAHCQSCVPEISTLIHSLTENKENVLGSCQNVYSTNPGCKQTTRSLDWTRFQAPCGNRNLRQGSQHHGLLQTNKRHKGRVQEVHLPHQHVGGFCVSWQLLHEFVLQLKSTKEKSNRSWVSAPFTPASRLEARTRNLKT